MEIMYQNSGPGNSFIRKNREPIDQAVKVSSSPIKASISLSFFTLATVRSKKTLHMTDSRGMITNSRSFQDIGISPLPGILTLHSQNLQHRFPGCAHFGNLLTIALLVQGYGSLLQRGDLQRVHIQQALEILIISIIGPEIQRQVIPAGAGGSWPAPGHPPCPPPHTGSGTSAPFRHIPWWQTSPEWAAGTFQ